MFVVKGKELGLSEVLVALVLDPAFLVPKPVDGLSSTPTIAHGPLQAPSVQQVGDCRVGDKIMSLWSFGPIVAHPEADGGNLGQSCLFRRKHQDMRHRSGPTPSKPNTA